MNVLDLFSGIGGFSLGLERAGMRTVAFCEIEPFARRVLTKNWPDVPCYPDVRELTAARLGADGVAPVDVICGGFPCQDISLAGKGAGLAGERSGLWREYARIIGEFRPRFVVVENVAALLGRGLGDVLGDLASLGYDAEWHCIPASAIGAPHRRDRVWIVAYADGEQCRIQQISRPECENTAIAQHDGSQGDVADAASERRGETRGFRRDQSPQRPPSSRETIPNSDRERLSGWDVGASIAAPRSRIFQGGELERACATIGRQQWNVEPDVGRVAHGVPDRVGQLRGYGNAVVPQIPEIIGRAIMTASQLSSHQLGTENER